MLNLIGTSQLVSVLRAYAASAFTMDESELLAVDPADMRCRMSVLAGGHGGQSQALYMLLPVRLTRFDLVQLEDGSTQINIPDATAMALSGYRETIYRESASPLVFASIGGADDIYLSVPRHWVPFDFVLPFRPDLPVVEGWQVVPCSVMEEVMQHAVSGIVSIYMGLRAFMPTARFVHIMPPPTKSDDEFVYEGLRLADKSLQLLQGVRHGVNPALYRLKAHLLFCHMLRQALPRVGVDHIDPPPESIDDMGYLRTRYYHDAAHANTQYGQLVLDQIERELARRGG